MEAWHIAPFVIASVVSIIILLAWWTSSESEWPPIDDEEFLRRCPSGTNRETALKVRQIISEQLGIPYEEIYPEQRFVEDLRCD